MQAVVHQQLIIPIKPSLGISSSCVEQQLSLLVGCTGRALLARSTVRTNGKDHFICKPFNTGLACLGGLPWFKAGTTPSTVGLLQDKEPLPRWSPYRNRSRAIFTEIFTSSSIRISFSPLVRPPPEQEEEEAAAEAVEGPPLVDPLPEGRGEMLLGRDIS